MKRDISSIRTEYKAGPLEEDQLFSDPMVQFQKWFEMAIASNVKEPNAMTLSTVSETGQPSSRIVLLKEANEEGFVFFTNYLSKKGREIESNNKVGLCFFWLELHRQIRIEGIAEKISFEESEAYFHSRPFGSQIGAITSSQSAESKGRAYLEKRYQDLYDQYEKAGKAPMPEHWGGYLVRPEYYEFWQGRESRLHDRFEYSKDKDNWDIRRLDP